MGDAMTETPGETPVERRLRELVQTRQSVERGRTTYDGDRWMPEHVALTQAIDAGCEAIALLREWEDVGMWGEPPPTDWQSRVRALLARCEETPR